MIFSLTAWALASALTAPTTSGTAALIGCHPHPGKVMGCAIPYGGSKARAQSGKAPPSAPTPTGPLRHCHPDPSKNKGCMRPSPSARS